MRWLADECVAAMLVERLRAVGHDVLYMAETHAGADDSTVLGFASGEERLLLTEDKDFGELIFRLRKSVPGVVLLRLGTVAPPEKWARLETALSQFGATLLGRYLVIDEKRIRFRPLLSSVPSTRE
jgi:predicted nuclease of predicted toxin-antitoxin system